MQNHRRWSDYEIQGTMDWADICEEHNAAVDALEAALAIPEPEPPCACKPWAWRDCTCGAYRSGKITMAQIDAYSEAREMWEEFRAALTEGNAP